MHCTMVPLAQVHARFRSFSLYPFVNRYNMKNTSKSRGNALFSPGTLCRHYARPTQHDGHRGWCHAWNRFKMKIFDKGYIQRFFTLFPRYFKRVFLPQNLKGTPNFHLHTIGGTLPRVPSTMGIVDHHPLHNGTTCKGTRTFSGFFSISLCK